MNPHRWSRAGVWVGVGALLVSAAATTALERPAMSAAPASSTLRTASQHVGFGGREFTTAGAQDPSMCSPANCDETRIHVDLPRRVWQRPDDGVQFSIRWDSIDDEFDLYVYGPDGALSAVQNQLDANAQSVVVPRAGNGEYRIVVAARYFSGGDTAVVAASGSPKRYDGVVHVHRGTRAGGRRRPLLPQIGVVPPHGFRLQGLPTIPSPPIGYRVPGPEFPTSCYADETASEGAQRCLRFDNELANVGDGPLELRFRWDDGGPINNCRMQQVLHWTDGSVTYRSAGPCVFHAAHAHFHYQHLGTFELYRVDTHGRRAASPIRTSRKIGFCLIDVDFFGFGRAGAAPRSYSFPTCNVPTQLGPLSGGPEPGVWEYMGIGRGWGDIYTWDLPSQYIDVDGVPDGVYDVVSIANPDGRILVKNRTGERSASRVELRGNVVRTLGAGVDANGHPTGDPRRGI